MLMNKKIFIACDTSNISKVKNIIKYTRTKKIKIGYKFGLEFLNTKYGRSYVAKIKKKIIFADLKLNDIPNTCASAVKAIKDLKVNYLTIHISSGLDALKAVKKVSGKTKIVGVSTLTSLNEKKLKQTGHTKSIKSLVIQQAKLAKKANLDALVCSAHEAPYIKKLFKNEIITPGIRLPGDKAKDQKRIMTPKKAFENGANSIVIGRSITNGNIKKNIQKLIKSLN
tara:strand:- start:782 stop:1459 length:678 start_codon:yes stop_codon:yes gene_type:complete